VSELYIYQNARCNIKNSVKFIARKTHYGVHRNPPLGTILGEVNPLLHISTRFILILYFNLNLSPLFLSGVWIKIL